MVAAQQRDVGGSLAAVRQWQQRKARWQHTARQQHWQWQQRGGCSGFAGTVRKCANARAFEHHQRANVCVFIFGRGQRDDSAEGIVIVGSDGGARGNVHCGCQCAAAAAANNTVDADGDANIIVC